MKRFLPTKLFNQCAIIAAELLLLLLAACSRGMYDDSKYKPFEESPVFPNSQLARTPVEGTVPWNRWESNKTVATGKANGELISQIPIKVDQTLLQRGRERYNIYCSPCHDQLGEGKGMIVQRGFKAPDDLASARLRRAPAGYFYEAITSGYKTMFPMNDQVPVRDRWAIVAYIRALQERKTSTGASMPLKQQVANAGGLE